MAEKSLTSPAPSPQPQPQPRSVIPKSLSSVSIASKTGHYFWSKTGVPDHAEGPKMTDSGTISGPMQQKYEPKSRPQTRLKWQILTSFPDRCNRGMSKKAVLRRV